MERIGLIAGGGKLPVIFAEEARKKGAKIIGFAIKEMALPEFDKACDRAHRLGIKQIKKFLFLLVAERIRKIVMLGKVDKSVIYNNKHGADEHLRRFEKEKDKSDYSILDKVTAEFEKMGIKVIEAGAYLDNLFPPKGILTKRHPSEKEANDVSFGFPIAREIARFDIGQTVIVKDKSVVSVEAMEGTDETIKRAAKLSGSGFTVIKVSRPEQDMRWDVPVVGPETIKLIAENKGKVLAIEAKRMFLVEREACLEIAEKNGISIVVK